MEQNWLTANVRVKFLRLENLVVNIIRKDAFNAPHFKILSELVIWSRISSFHNGAFNGLENLKKLILKSIEVIKFNPELLAPLQIIEWFTMENSIDFESFDNLFGTVKLNHLKYVKIVDCNLRKMINKLTFIGLTNINEFYLLNDRIEKIGSHSFDAIFIHLKVLSLTGNNLKCLPENIFSVTQGNLVSIKLHRNELRLQLHCDCDLEPLRIFIQSSIDVDSKNVRCLTPYKCSGEKIDDFSSLCFESEAIASATIINPFDQDDSFNVTDSEPQNDSSGQFSMIHCESKSVSIKATIKLTNSLEIHFHSIRMKKGKLVLNTAHISKNVFYFVYEQYEKKILKCIGNLTGDKFTKIRMDLNPNQMYRLCGIKRTHHLINPFECMPFFSDYNESNLDTWITIKYKTASIAFCIFLAIFMLFNGMLIAFFWPNHFERFIKPI